MKVRSLALSAAALVGATACGSSPPATHVQVSGGTAAQRALVGQIIERSGARSVREVRMLPRDPRRGGRRLVLLSERGGRGYIEEAVVATAFVDESQRRGLPFFGSVELDSGAVRSDWRGAGAPDARAVDSYAARARSAVAAADAQLRELRIVRAGDSVGLAVAVEAEDPARFLKYRAEHVIRALGRRPHGLLGFGLDVFSRDGDLLLWVGGLRAGWATGSDPIFAGCDPTLPYRHSSYVRPCPA